MTNLKMPDFNYEALKQSLGDKNFRTIAYATTAEKLEDGIGIRHHGSLIAKIQLEKIWVSMAGWNSNTTKERLDAILWANFQNRSWRIRKHDYETIIHRAFDDYRKPKTAVSLCLNDAWVYADGKLEVC